ncbi:CoA pyrophosphatase [Sphingomonas solaris]|uniref:CoA pyrophosphatase n=1 Tax=Alterirhizorhabdus solaris TaxID=2529389 RepID=A0A558R234_9SPHN|nr:CoA pyrophosphatase [Sphingomonas solaris]TVV73388.1 CoA pyrophosphatase [Sphingomonas solaris]
MTLAERLRRALEDGVRHADGYLGGDTRDLAQRYPQGFTPAAVLVPIVERPEPGVLLTLRNAAMRQHAGQIAFPGGRMDPGDDGPVAAALREAEEEIGLPRAAVQVIGTADRYQTGTGYEVTPVIGLIAPDTALVPHPGEVADIFEVPLDFLLDPRNHGRHAMEWEGRERRYFEIMWNDRRIWGATAGMIVNLSRRLATIA